MCDIISCIGNLSCLANLAAIFTAAIAVSGYGKYLWDNHSRREKLENYLKNEKKKATDKGQRSVLHLMAHLNLTEAEILHASFSSKHITGAVAVDPKTNRAEALLFEYEGKKAES